MLIEKIIEARRRSRNAITNESKCISFKEIKELRQTGKLDEALQLATEALENQPDNIWYKRAVAWVYYDYLKYHLRSDSYENFKQSLLSIKDLRLPEDETMIFDNSAWQVGAMVFRLLKKEPINYMLINELIDIIKEFNFSKPSESYTYIFKAFHKAHPNWSKYLDFADWWDFENFRSEDYLTEEFQGKKIMSIVEQAHIAYAKKLLEHISTLPPGQEKLVAKDKVSQFLSKIDRLIQRHPEYKYPPFFKAKLLLAFGEVGNALSSFLPFAMQKRNEFWVWQLMAEIFPEDNEIQFSCYCKALSLKTPNDFLVRIRQIFAEKLIERQLYNEAKTEIQLVISTREKNGWNLPHQITHWTEQDWFKSVSAKTDNKDLYSQYIKKAEALLLQDIPEEVVAVEFVNENKNVLNFVKNKQKFGFFNYYDHLDKVRIGDILKVRFNGDGVNGFYKVFSARKAESDIPSDAIRFYSGVLKVISPRNFGFVDQVYVDPQIIKDNNLKDGQVLTGKSMLSFNKKRKEWGWKAIN